MMVVRLLKAQGWGMSGVQWRKEIPDWNWNQGNPVLFFKFRKLRAGFTTGDHAYISHHSLLLGAKVCVFVQVAQQNITHALWDAEGAGAGRGQGSWIFDRTWERPNWDRQEIISWAHQYYMTLPHLLFMEEGMSWEGVSSMYSFRMNQWKSREESFMDG